MVLIYHLLVFVTLMVAAVSSETCRYAKFSSDHTACKQPNQTCQILDQGLSRQDRGKIIYWHNKFRNIVATGQEKRGGGLPTAANMRQLVWDRQLEKVAQAHANQCVFDHDCTECRRVGRFEVGQNLYGYSGEIGVKDIRDMVTKFFNEVAEFDKNNIDPYVHKKGTGHFSQVVWADSYRIGCGRTTFMREGRPFHMIACNYGPAGNVEGTAMYKVGEPCSACPEGTSCTGRFPGLCKKNRKQ